MALIATVTVQLPTTGIDMPLKERLVWPTEKLVPPAPLQVPPAAPVALTCMLVSVSLKVAPVRGMLPTFARVKVIVLLLPSPMVAGLKPLVMIGVAATLR